ncbi:hypothetical protein MXD59_01535 [Frankia sp. Ag45/Mut15]|uniref:Flap endonuclease-1-like 5' DNA nuclease n=1 Tax=Frankia umida TaxID=573489 RepID=A0ABT0JSP3_9ACTN|nr:hypothetical protein [Frankia umida]MCK9874476.1 hypothetical protein [Frankia umida]
MLYLAGQILAYVLVAMVIGAALAWVFLIAPLRRQIRTERATQRPGITTATTDATDATRPGLVSSTSRDEPVVAIGRPVAGSANEPAGTSTTTATPAEPVPTEPVLAAAPALAAPVPAEPVVAEPVAGAPVASGPVHDDPVAPEPAMSERLVAEPGVAEPGVAEAEPAEGEPAGGEWGAGRPAVGAELATTGPITMPLHMVRAVEPVAELVDLLRRQRDDAALERADLTARLAVAEQRAAEAEQRTSAAERHAVTASARVEEIDAALRARVEAVTRPVSEAGPSSVEIDDDAAIEPGVAIAAGAVTEAGVASDGADDALDGAAERVAPPSGPTVAELVQAAEHLRQQLDEAEGRAAKFSSRLAMARTEAEDAQRQVATLSTRLDRHQAEWAVERQRLLSRITRSESAVGLEPPTGVETAADVAPRAVPPQAATVDPLTDVETTADADPVADVDATADAEVVDVETAVEVPVARVRPVGAVTKERPSAVAGAPLRGPAGLATSPGVRRGATGEQTAGGQVVMESSPRWNGLLDPSAVGGDNLKEIVGVGPVIESRLRTLGITTFGQLAEMGDTDVERLARMLDGFGDRIISDDWVGQAQDLQVRHYGGV